MKFRNQSKSVNVYCHTVGQADPENIYYIGWSNFCKELRTLILFLGRNIYCEPLTHCALKKMSIYVCMVVRIAD